MRIKTYITFLIPLIVSVSYGQELSLKEAAIEEFKKENYPNAIEILKTALKESPNDAEIYYYLGFFTHYNAYDSRPLASYRSTYSDTVFQYLDKALELNPNYGDAKYFYTAECGAAAFLEVNNGNLEKVKEFYEKAYIKGGFPKWALEYGRHTLALCDTNAILFTHGDFILNVCWYLQLCKSFRTDISVIPLAVLDRPWFAIKIKSGNIFKPVKMNISENQLLDMHPYKWDTTTISIDVPDPLIKKFNLRDNYKMNWVVKPDYISNRIVSKIEGEKAKRRTYLSGHRAVLLSIIETNQWERPIFFARGFELFYLAGLEQYFQNCGLVSKLLPMKTENTDSDIDIDKLEYFVFETSLKDYNSVIKTDQPRASNCKWQLQLHSFS